jgi:glycosidase
LNLLGSHDTARWLTVCGNDVRRAMLGYMLLFTLPGAPCIYYGDEIGMTGEADPHCRACFEWDKRKWNRRLHQHLRDLISLRHSSTAWRTGAFEVLTAENSVFAYARWNASDAFVVIMNNSKYQWEGAIPLRKRGLPPIAALQDMQDGETLIPRGKVVRVRIPPYSHRVLQARAD